MKIKNLIWVAILGIGFISCHDLDLKPKGMIGEAELFSNEEGVQRYFTGLYSYLPIEDFVFRVDRGNGYRGNDPWDDWNSIKQNLQNASAEFVNSWTNNPNFNRDYWPYDRIREVNVFINGLPNYKENFTDYRYNELMGEARFLRAFFYFGLVKYRGGVPIIKGVQYPTDPIEDLMVKRDTEYDTWKFIYDDLAFAIDNMTSTPDVHRGSKYTAAALMSRAMLYAGSVAKYTQYVGLEAELAYQQGLAGMSADKANEFFQYSLAASKLIAESGKYELYNKNTDLVQNFVDVFLDTSSPENILVRNYFPTGITDPRNTYLIPHGWDCGMAPNPDMSSFVGSESYPALDFVRIYEIPDNWIVNEDGTPKRFSDRGEIREGLEPRLRGSAYFNGDVLRGVTYQIQRGLYTKFPWPASAIVNGDANDPPNLSTNLPEDGKRIVNTSNNRNQYYNPTDGTINETGNGIRILSPHGTLNQGGGENNCLTGMYVRKYVNYNMPTSEAREHRSSQAWIAFRLGEIYLNLAEAAYELGDKATAAEYIRKIRVRAGCKNVDMPNDATDVGQAIYGYPLEASMQYIRDERRRELWGEQHYWFDLRRWRTADRILNRYIPRILSCYYVIDEDKYIYLDEREMSQRNWTANRDIYYLSIPSGEINKNINLLPQNPFR